MNELTKTPYFKLSEKIISLDTVSCLSTNECVQVLADELQNLGFNIHIDNFNDGNVQKGQILAWIGPDTDNGLILSGHIDTVPYATQTGWEVNPTGLTLKEEKLFGRGTCDMKLFLVQCIEALKNIPLTKLKHPIVLIFTCDEEIGCLGAKRIVRNIDSLTSQMPLPTRAIIGEPTSFEIINTHKGIAHFDLNIKGKGGHSSRPHIGINSIAPLGKIITLINQLNDEFQSTSSSEHKKLFPDTPYNYLHMAMLNAGQALNMIPDLTTMRMSYRCFPGENPEYVLNKFKSELDKLKLDTIEIKNVHFTPGMPLSKNQELSDTLKSFASSDQMKAVSFATDGGYFSQAGIHSFIFGPGEIKMAHQPNEYMPLEDFIKGPQILSNILMNLVL